MQLDKLILLNAKREVLWNDETKQNTIQKMITDDKKLRQEKNLKQKDAYCQMLLFVKRRGTNPLEEERQILDGLKIILENGWSVETQELLRFFQMIGIHKKAWKLADNTRFQ